jgi:cell wall-associated NlpC family hydrolase
LRSTTGITKSLAVGAVLAVGLLTAGPASAQTGGSAAPGSVPPATTPTVPGAKAKLRKNGKAIAPAGAPSQVVAAIAAGNAIRKKPYRYGGGHRSFDDTGYDCSGAVSYVLRAAGMLASPMPSGPLMSWGEPGKGTWITVFAHGGHAYMKVAGLRFDTSSMGSGGNGPRWRSTKRSAKGFTVRHWTGF